MSHCLKVMLQVPNSFQGNFSIHLFRFQMAEFLLSPTSRLHILIDIILNPVSYFCLIFVTTELPSAKSTFVFK